METLSKREKREKTQRIAYAKVKKRLIFTFGLVCLCCVALIFRLGWIQVVQGEELTKMARNQQMKDVTIEAKRGIIYDRNMEELAISAPTFSLWARPDKVKAVRSGKEEDEQVKISQTVATLAPIISMDEATLREIITRKQGLVKVTKYLDKETADKIRAAELPGFEISEEVKRYYPLGAFASHLLGSVTDDNRGLAGIEMRYDRYLAGVPGRWIKNTDVAGNSLSYGVEKYYGAEDGLNVVLTIDEVIQHYAEQAIQEAVEKTGADRVMCLMMDPKTCDVLAMAVSENYDPNNPRTPLDPEKAAYYDTLSQDDKLTYLNKMWRNPIVSDVYEPGSTSKLLTTAIALEEGLTNLNEGFYCSGTINVAGTTLKCWRFYRPHGHETLVQAVGNSCNPVFVQLGQRIGMERFYNYMELFGMTEKTGVDYPGEAGSILQKKESAGPVGLATMSYGQGIAVTMIQQLTAVCSLGNEGKLMAPRIVKALTDSKGEVVKEFDTKVVRQVISPQTAEEMCLIMESVVSEGGGGNAKVPGFRVGGKTGTANKAAGGSYSEQTYSSFIGMAPMDDPQVALLLVVDNPKGVKYGSMTAAPAAKQIFENTLRYLNVKPKYTNEEEKLINSNKAVVPNVTGENGEQAMGILAGAKLEHSVSPAYTGTEDFMVLDQYPKAGEKVAIGSTVILYRE